MENGGTPRCLNYKKRFSFYTEDKLFRIDISGIKTNEFKRGKYSLTKTFKESNILYNPENYELEIEFIGSNPDNKDGLKILSTKKAVSNETAFFIYKIKITLLLLRN